MATKKEIDELERLLAVQCTNGTWDHSPYMHGMANGMILALSVLTDHNPAYLEKPDIFLCELKELDKFNNSPIIVHSKPDKGKQ